mgnify:CR=1 FL=1
MKNIILALVFILSSVNVMADLDIEPEDFVPKGLKIEDTYELGYSSKKIESSFAIFVYNPDKDERGIVIVNKTRKGKYIKIAENLDCLFGDSAVSVGADDHSSDDLYVEADGGTLRISYSQWQHKYDYKLHIIDDGVQLGSFEEMFANSVNRLTQLWDFDKMKLYHTDSEKWYQCDDNAWNVNITDEEYDISFDKGYKNPTLKNLLDFRKGLNGLPHYKEKLVKTETREE